jgi:hypothetical protein
MRRRLLYLLVLLLFSICCMMVSCNAPGCMWEKATGDSRGLNRHRATCKFYHRSSVASCQKRQERAKQAAITLARLPAAAKRSFSSSSVSCIFCIWHSSDSDNYHTVELMTSSLIFLDIAHSASGGCSFKTHYAVSWPQTIK